MLADIQGNRWQMDQQTATSETGIFLSAWYVTGVFYHFPFFCIVLQSLGHSGRMLHRLSEYVLFLYLLHPLECFMLADVQGDRWQMSAGNGDTRNRYFPVDTVRYKGIK